MLLIEQVHEAGGFAAVEQWVEPECIEDICDSDATNAQLAQAIGSRSQRESQFEIRKMGSDDARAGVEPQYRKSTIYMRGYRYRSQDMKRRCEGPHCILPLVEGTYLVWGEDEEF